jgi:chemotaxis protein MotB
VRARNRGRGGLDAWPGYVDALSTLLMVITFVLLVFVLAQGFLSVALNSRDQALERLNRQVSELSDLLALEQGQATELRAFLSRASEELRAMTGARDRLADQQRSLAEERARLLAERDAARAERTQAAARLADLEIASRTGVQRLTGAEAQIAEAQARAEAAARDAASTAQRLAAEQQSRLGAERSLNETRGALETARLELATLRRQLAEGTAELAAAQRRIQELREAEAALDRTVRADRATIEARLSDIARLEREIAALTALRNDAETRARAALTRAGEGERAAGEQQRLAEAARAQVALLSRQLEELRGQLARLNAALGESETRQREGDSVRENLQAQLAVALAQRVEELQRYRSEFFGQLRQVLGDRPELRVVGDRFVFPSEVLFPPGSTDLSPAGQAQIRQIASVVREVAARIPPEIPWVLRVDGHADRTPQRGPRFASNWELSAARAIAVANLLIEAGLPPNRVAAAAFGEFQPLEPGDTPEALARNRRIELRLTDR